LVTNPNTNIEELDSALAVHKQLEEVLGVHVPRRPSIQDGTNEKLNAIAESSSPLLGNVGSSLQDVPVSADIQKKISDIRKDILKKENINLNKYFCSCFLNGLNKVMAKFLKHDGDGTKFGKNFDPDVGHIKIQWGLNGEELEQYHVPLLLQEFKVNENILVEVLERYCPQIASCLHLVTPDTKENILHVLLRKNMGAAIQVLMNLYKVDDLHFGVNFAGNTPTAQAMLFNSFIESKFKDDKVTDVASLFWREVVRISEKKSVHLRLTRLNAEKQNILHVCVENSLNYLFLKILRDPKVSKQALAIAINQRNVEGLTAIDECTHQKTVLDAMDIFPDCDIEHLDANGNNVLHINSIKNFSYAIKRIIQLVPEKETLKKLLLHSNNNGNNPLMESVLKNSNESLNLLLWTLYEIHGQDKSEAHHHRFITKILHDKNANGENLMGLILHFQQGVTISQLIALEVEKDAHNRANEKLSTMIELSECFRENVGASAQVVQVLSDVEESFPKTRMETCELWLTMFFTDFLIPMAIMIFDITFDIILVYRYSDYFFHDDWEDAIYDCGSEKHTISTTIDTAMPSTNSTFLPRISGIDHIPQELNRKSRFFYSLSFLVIPWIFYMAEFCNSKELDDIIRKVCLTLFCTEFGAYFVKNVFNCLKIYIYNISYNTFLDTKYHCKSKTAR
jgi:hypothetical protein